ncbi:YqhV family protein [Alteribacter aurantiacus]|uniref:YqhV family protein n=1 Tax=Alteribacter aurantiacus TaxID=254410 RepID=UPI00040E3117|nr:YqhV family protein [Alteribacter aurantiacus]
MKDWITGLETAVLIMVCLRIFSGLAELTVAGLIFRFNSVEKALVLNAALAVIGPTVLILSVAIGVYALADSLSFTKIALIFGGVLLILIGVKS